MHKILVADDLPLNVEYLVEELGPLGFTVITAADGRETLQQVRDNAPDLVLLDLSMPGMDGIEGLESLRQDTRYQSLPVLLLTASDETEDRVRGLNAGADDYITKLFKIEEGVARIRAHLRIQTLQKQVLERERLLARVEGIGQTLVTLSHHLNNASQAMSGMAQLCEMEPENTEHHQDLTRVTLKQTARISAVLQSFQMTVEKVEIKTADYVGDPDRMLDIEDDLERRLKDLDLGGSLEG